jgi:condensin complex subunit 2
MFVHIDETFAGDTIPFSTQFFNDDDDDAPGFDDGFEGPITDGALPDINDGEQDLLTGSQAPKRRIKPEFVNYAKRAKRVDVRKLKENIWRGLDIVVPKPKTEDDMVCEPSLYFVLDLNAVRRTMMPK